MHNEAILVMDSRTESGSVRSQALSADWSKLYKTEDYFLDLTLHHKGSETILMGHILATESSQQVVGTVATPDKRYIPLDASGSFRVSLEPGLHDLHFHLSSGVIAVRGLEA